MTRKNFSTRWWLEVTRGCERAIAWSKRASRAMARPGLLAAMLLVLVPLAVMLLKPASKASGGIIVNTLLDETTPSDGLCSLREAITNAHDAAQTYPECADPGGTTAFITFTVTGTITLGGTLPTIPGTNTLTIDGSGQKIIIDGANTYQVFQNDGTLTLNDLTIANGNQLLSPLSWRRGL